MQTEERPHEQRDTKKRRNGNFGGEKVKAMRNEERVENNSGEWKSLLETGERELLCVRERAATCHTLTLSELLFITMHSTKLISGCRICIFNASKLIFLQHLSESFLWKADWIRLRSNISPVSGEIHRLDQTMELTYHAFFPPHPPYSQQNALAETEPRLRELNEGVYKRMVHRRDSASD